MFVNKYCVYSSRQLTKTKTGTGREGESLFLVCTCVHYTGMKTTEQALLWYNLWSIAWPRLYLVTRNITLTNVHKLTVTIGTSHYKFTRSIKCKLNHTYTSIGSYHEYAIAIDGEAGDSLT